MAAKRQKYFIRSNLLTWSVVELATDQIMDDDLTEDEARKLAREYCKGVAFDGDTPAYFFNGKR